MKKNLTLLAVGTMFFFLFAVDSGAQDMKSNPKMSQILADTTFLRAAIITLEPGAKTDMHTHPAHFLYALSEGKILVHYKDGTSETMELKPGMAAVAPPEKPHMTENVGTTTVKFIIVELKEHPYTAER
jgi:mannose-6-phosphate isomerase-like protein (cupin superfamily)